MNFEKSNFMILFLTTLEMVSSSVIRENKKVEVYTAPSDLSYQFFRTSTNHLHIRVKAKMKAQIALTSTPYTSNPMYEVFIGSWDNSVSYIRRNQSNRDALSVVTTDVLDPNKYKGFWIQWDNQDRGSITVGNEGSHKILMKWNDLQLPQFTYFGISTGWESGGHWIIHSIAPLGNYNWEKARTVYDFSAKSVYGEDVPLNIYRGHVLVIVNVASSCRYAADHYPELSELIKLYTDKGLRILIFPSNQFFQESGTNVQILEFAKRINSEFEIFDKVDVNGVNALPLYKFLKSKKGGIITDVYNKTDVFNLSRIFNNSVFGNLCENVAELASSIKWNFTKFIINRRGIPVHRAGPNIKPLDKVSFLSILEKCLEEKIEY